LQGKGFGIKLLDHADQQMRLWGLPEVRSSTWRRASGPSIA
jgi:hypothetical protein